MGKVYHNIYEYQSGVYNILKNKFKFVLLGLLSALFLFLTIPNVGASTTTVVTGDTSAGKNQPGWLFNRDLSTSTPFEFNTDQASIGAGSLYVEPISSSPSDKFIAENFLLTPIADVNSVSYDFMIGSGGSAGDANQFYLNVYANFGESDDTKFYDCRYNIVPSSGSTSSFTSVNFDPTSSYGVTTRGSSPYSCPASPADMDTLSPGSNIRAFAINVGDTSASDTGLDGYLDNVVVDKSDGTTIYDFEYDPDPTNSHQFNVSGDVYRDVALNDCDNKSECENKAENLSDWEARLYKENSSGEWELVDTDVTDTDGKYKFATQYNAGVYHTCEVLKDGWTQQKQTWGGSGYKVETDNLSGDLSEGPYCNTLTYDDTHDRSSKAHIGNVDTKKPFTEVLSPLENGYYNNSSTLEINIKSTDNESGIVKAVANLYSSESGFIGPCINHTVSPAESEYNFSCNVDISGLGSDGQYYIKTNARDAGNNLSNTVTWYFNVDNTPPSKPQMLGFYKGHNSNLENFIPCDGFTNTPQIRIDWEENPESDIAYYWLGTKFNTKHKKVTSPTHYNANMTPGNNPYHYTIIAVDKAGNESEISDQCGLTLDQVAPVVTVTPLAGDGILHGTVTFDITVTDDNLDPSILDHIWTYIYNNAPPQTSKGDSIDLSSGHGTFTVNTKLLDDGAATLDVGKLYDAAGNPSGTGDNYFSGYTIDNTAPDGVFVSPASLDIAHDEFTIEVEINDPSGLGSQQIVMRDTGGAVAGNWSYNVKNPGASNTIAGPAGTFDYTGDDFSGNLKITFDTNDLPADGQYNLRLFTKDALGNGRSNIYASMLVDNTAPEIDISNIEVNTDKKLSFDLLATDNGPSGLEIVAANIYDETNTTKLISLGKNSSGGSTGTTRLNEPYSGLPVGTSTFPKTLSDVDVSSLAPGVYTIRAYAKDHATNELRFKLVQFIIFPIISNEDSTNPTTTSVTIVWDTDHPTTSKVVYDTVSHGSGGVPPNYGYAFSTVEDSTKVTSHSVTVTGLTPGTTYYFRTVSHGSPESVSGEIVATTNSPASSSSSSSSNSSNNSFNGQGGNGGTGGFGGGFATLTNNPDGTGQVLGAQNDGNDGNNQNNNGDNNGDDEGNVQSEGAGISSASTDNKSSFSWWWLLIVAAILALIYAIYRRRRRNAEEWVE